jgi:hypothetical protein
MSDKRKPLKKKKDHGKAPEVAVTAKPVAVQALETPTPRRK